MSPAGIVGPVYILEQSQFRLSPRFPLVAPDQLCLQRLEEALGHGARHCARTDGAQGLPITITLAAHRYLEAVFPRAFLIVARAVLAAATGVVPVWWMCPRGVWLMGRSRQAR